MENTLYAHYWKDFIIPAMGTTLYILLLTIIIDAALGLIIAMLLYITAEDGLRPHRKIHSIVSTVVNIIRSVPSVIMIIVLFPIARLILGSAIGRNAAVIYMSIMCVAFVARVFEEKLQIVDKKLILAGKAMGLNDWQILTRIVLHEAIPSLVLGIAFAAIMIMGNIAFAGCVGAGGIGEVAMTHGYVSFNSYVMYSSILLMFLMTFGIQLLGKMLYNKLK